MISEPQTRGPRRDRAPAGPDDSLSSHRLVGRYELIQRLARGGMATVYLGRSTGKAGFEKVVAVKVIHPHLADEPQFVGMFLDEARIAARIHHPHVVEILDLGEDDGVYYMVMELVEGDNLAALTKSHGDTLPVALSLQIVSDALAGLAAAHELRDGQGHPYRLVHRDVSPHNLLINLEGWVKVADFGIMKAAGKTSSTKTGELRGKLAYMSPEQARGADIDLRSDLFAVGVILWEMLTGRRLFAERTEAATLEKVVRCEVPSLTRADAPALREASDELIAGIDAVIARALAADRERRFAAAAQMREEVDRLARLVQAGEPGTPEPRARLAELMTRHFGARAAYARAALRAPSPTQPVRHRSSMMGLEAVARRAASVSSFDDTQVGVAPESVDAVSPKVDSTPSRPVVVAERSSSTLTATLPGVRHPLLQWGMWMLLPAIGAAIAIVVMLGGERGRQSDAAAAPEGTRPTEPVAGEVTWFLDTVPRGAIVTVDGVAQAEPTPLTVVVPRGKQPVPVVFELAGHLPERVRLPPLEDRSFAAFELTPVGEPRSQPEAAVTTSSPTRFMPRAKHHTDPRVGGGSGTEGAIGDGRTDAEQPAGSTGTSGAERGKKGVFEPLPEELGKAKGSPPAASGDDAS